MPTSSADPVRRGKGGLVVEGLGAGYGGELVVREVDLEVGEGEIATVVGPNGSGKSTLLKGITGVIVVSEGRVLLRDQDITRLGTDVIMRRGVGYVPQLNDIFAPLTVEENLQAGGYTLRKSEVSASMQRVMEIFPMLGVMRSRTAGRLSGGERKMLAIGRALMVQPPVLILDEPTANLSPALARIVLEEYVARLKAAGVAVLLVEQRAREALKVSDWGYVMVAGRLAVSSSASELADRDDMGELFLGRARNGSASVRAVGTGEQS
jgi:ABC-type branched-subunit amino acid transport system ATPase component